MRNHLHAFTAASLAVVVAGCGSSGPTEQACTAILLAGLVVSVEDSVTGIVPTGVTLIARTAGATDSIGPTTGGTPTSPPRQLTAAPERPGTYTVEIRSAGYQTWRKNGVVVGFDGCHVKPVHLTARLQRSVIRYD